MVCGASNKAKRGIVGVLIFGALAIRLAPINANLWALLGSIATLKMEIKKGRWKACEEGCEQVLFLAGDHTPLWESKRCRCRPPAVRIVSELRF